MLLVNITKYLDKKFNPKKASDWDNVGFQIFNKKPLDANFNVNKVLICLDLTNDCLEYAIKNNVNLIISRHPFIFAELKQEKQNPIKKEMIKKLTKHNIVVFSIHTNYDASSNQNLTEIINKEIEIKKYKKYGYENESNIFYFKKEIKIEDLIKSVSKIFNSESIRFNSNTDLNSKTNQMYITTGSGASTMIYNSLKKCVFITGEVKWNEWIYANDNNVCLVELGHYMENYFVDDIKNKLANKFNDLEILTYDINNQFITRKKV
ncbi:Nif3-like dinuclear metal center hexameric protein [Mycoplasma sp. HU2014]|uniref:Nif3-like dinuclear metal center hexameric protein n=1 Tax=Mycoplasma sp. HU2014 TaxID=1664275 RepID=UPI00067AE119|nr:Nif3-like dinuclear metal center hexameric protein [Mycoplasma sp. HU2014]KNG79258.1 NIF3 family protein [Mycoplasma sp. HU2014]